MLERSMVLCNIYKDLKLYHEKTVAYDFDTISILKFIKRGRWGFTMTSFLALNLSLCPLINFVMKISRRIQEADGGLLSKGLVQHSLTLRSTHYVHSQEGW
jgi:hypothetical protein